MLGSGVSLQGVNHTSQNDGRRQGSDQGTLGVSSLPKDTLFPEALPVSVRMSCLPIKAVSRLNFLDVVKFTSSNSSSDPIKTDSLIVSVDLQCLSDASGISTRLLKTLSDQCVEAISSSTSLCKPGYLHSIQDGVKRGGGSTLLLSEMFPVQSNIKLFQGTFNSYTLKASGMRVYDLRTPIGLSAELTAKDEMCIKSIVKRLLSGYGLKGVEIEFSTDILCADYGQQKELFIRITYPEDSQFSVLGESVAMISGYLSHEEVVQQVLSSALSQISCIEGDRFEPSYTLSLPIPMEVSRSSSFFSLRDVAGSSFKQFSLF